MASTTRFTGKVALITGAASGIGRATALKLASQGCTLSLQDINETGLAETKHLCAGSANHHTQAFSVSDPSACTAFIQTTIQTLGSIDFVFNCAGVNPTAFPLTETTDAYFAKLVDTNLKGTYNITRAVIPHSPTSIVNVSSTMGVSVAPEYAIYCATKWAIVGFTKAVALEVGARGIRVNAVAPGYIDTPTNAGVLEGPEAVEQQVRKVALGRMGTAEEVADVVAFLFSDESRYMSGSVVEITGGRKT